MTQEEKRFLDNLDDELLISFLCIRYGTTIPIWKRCSKEEYLKNVPTSDKLDAKWLKDNLKYLFSGKTYRRVPVYYNTKGGILEQIELAHKEPDTYYYEKRIGSKFVIMLGSEMMNYCQTRECMKQFLDKVQLIKQEIESYKESMKGLEPHSDFRRGQITAYNQILQFINSIPEESGCEKKDYCERYEKLTQSDTFKSSYCDKSLGKEESTDEANCTTKNQDLEEAAKHYLYGAILYDDVYVGNPTEEDCIRCFKAGAEWQRHKDQQTIELAEEHALLAGMMKEREEMMKDAVDATIVNDWQYGKDPDHAVIPAIHQRIDGFNVGDKVKIIIVKEE